MASIGRPGLVIARRRRTDTQRREAPRRTQRARRARHVRQMILLPTLLFRRIGGWRISYHMMDPAMPFRRHAGRFDGAVVDDPAPHAVFRLIIVVAELVL